MEAAALLGFAINEGLNAEADSIDACLGQRIEGCVGYLAGSALDGDLGIGLDRELRADGGEKLRNQIRLKQAGCSAAEIDGIDAGREICAKVLAPLARAAHLIDEALDVAGVLAGRIYA